MVFITKDKDLSLQKLDTGSSIWANAYLVTCAETNESVLVDAPGKSDLLLQQVRNKNIKYILMTHSHSDHTGALSRLKSTLHAQVGGHPADAAKYPVVLTVELSDGNTIIFGRKEIRVIHTPGHTPGSLCFLVGKHLLCGDTIFPGGPGYTSSPEDFEEIVNSITQKIFTLPDETIIYPGHGESSVLGKEKDEYKAFTAHSHISGLCGDVIWLKS